MAALRDLRDLRALLACLLLASLASGCLSGPTAEAPGVAADDLPAGDAEGDGEGEGEEPAGATGDAQADDDGDAEPGGGSGPPQADPGPAAAACAAPAVHGEPQRDDGTVDTAPEGGTFVARRTVTIANDFGGAPRSTVLLQTFNGAMAVLPSTDCGYRLVAQMYGRGATPDDARQALDLLTLTATDHLAQGTLDLSFVVASGAPEAVPLPINLGSGVNHGAAFQLWLPPGPAHDLEARTSNAAIGVQGLHGPRLNATSSNAALSAEGTFDEILLGTSNGAIELTGTFRTVVAQTANAAIDAELRPAHSGSVRLGTSNAAIGVALPRDASAFDITAGTTNGRVGFDLEGREAGGDGHATFRSADWGSAKVQVTLDLGTSNAAILVKD